MQKWLFKGLEKDQGSHVYFSPKALPTTKCAGTKQDSEKSSRKQLLRKYRLHRELRGFTMIGRQNPELSTCQGRKPLETVDVRGIREKWK